MTTGMTVGTATGNKAVSELWVGTATGNKEVTEGWIGTAAGNKQFYASEAFEAVAESSVTWTDLGDLSEGGDPDNHTFLGTAEVVASGGAGGYGYAWEITAGGSGVSIESPSSSATNLAYTGTTPPSTSVKCVVTDGALASVDSNTVTVNGVA